MLASLVLSRCRSLRLTKKELARRAGVSRETLYRILRGESHGVTIDTLFGLADALHVAPLQLLREAYQLGRADGHMSMARGAADEASFVSDANYPNYEVVAVNQTFTKVWEIQNTGDVTWRGRSFRCEDDQVLLVKREADGSFSPVVDAALTPLRPCVAVPTTVPGGVARIAVGFRAPSVPCTTISHWKMYEADGTLCVPQFPGLWCTVCVKAL
jgi:transcriptional regulator with XRE-family HTH domain